jgi:hypothetical protein
MAQQHPYTYISSLLLPMFSGDRNEYGQEAAPPTPLVFDKVSEGRAPKLNAPFLKLVFRNSDLNKSITAPPFVRPGIQNIHAHKVRVYEVYACEA